MKYRKCPCCQINYTLENKQLCKICYYSNEGRDFLKRLDKNGPDSSNFVIQHNSKEEKIKLLEKLETFGFQGFLHTTNFDNFINIFKMGFLYPRKELKEQNIPFTDNANFGVIQNTRNFVFNMTRFFYRTKTPTNYSAFHSYNQTKPVIMVFDKNIIFENNVLFCDGCAATTKINITKDVLQAINFDWDEIFSNKSYDETDNVLNYEGIGPKRYRNAEFLFPGKISITNIVKVYFKTQKDLDNAKNILGHDRRFELNRDMFVGGYYD